MSIIRYLALNLVKPLWSIFVNKDPLKLFSFSHQYISIVLLQSNFNSPTSHHNLVWKQLITFPSTKLHYHDGFMQQNLVSKKQ